MISLIKKFLKKRDGAKKVDYDWENFRKSAGNQFRKLKEQGIRLPIFTL